MPPAAPTLPSATPAAASACAGDAASASLAGAENLSAPTMIELRVAAQRGFAADERLACQAVVMGDVEVTTTTGERRVASITAIKPARQSLVIVAAAVARPHASFPGSSK